MIDIEVLQKLNVPNRIVLTKHAKERLIERNIAITDIINGKLVSSHKENVALQQGKNKLDVSGIDFTNSDSISVMVWDSMISMRPLADKATINK